MVRNKLLILLVGLVVLTSSIGGVAATDKIRGIDIATCIDTSFDATGVFSVVYGEKCIWKGNNITIVPTLRLNDKEGTSDTNLDNANVTVELEKLTHYPDHHERYFKIQTWQIKNNESLTIPNLGPGKHRLSIGFNESSICTITIGGNLYKINYLSSISEPIYFNIV